MWLVFSLIAPVFFAAVHVLDAYCVEDVFEKPWMGMITSALASIVFFIPLPYLLPLLNWQMPSLTILAIALSAGALIQISQGFYFQALAYSEAGIVAAYWNMVPAIVPLLSIVVFNESLSFIQYSGITILIFASVLFCLLDSNKKARWQSLVLMLIAGFMQAIMFLLQDIAYKHMNYLQAFTIITLGLVIAGCLPLALKSVRLAFSRNAPVLIPATKFFIIIEIINLVALACSQKAVDLGIPSLVAAVESTIPAYTFILMIILLKIAPKYADNKAWNRLYLKVSLVLVMTGGVSMLT